MTFPRSKRPRLQLDQRSYRILCSETRGVANIAGLDEISNSTIFRAARR